MQKPSGRRKQNKQKRQPRFRPFLFGQKNTDNYIFHHKKIAKCKQCLIQVLIKSPHRQETPLPVHCDGAWNCVKSNWGITYRILRGNVKTQVVTIRDFPDHATFREKGAKLACADKLGVFLSLTLCNKVNFNPLL